MANKPDNVVWDNLGNNLAANGFFFNTDPRRPGGGRPNLVEEPEEAIRRREKASVIDKMVSVPLDIPIAISAKAGDLTGRGFQYLSEKTRQLTSKIDQVPIINKIDDGIKAIDKAGILSSLSKGQLPGSESVQNFLSDGVSRVSAMKAAPWIGKLVAFPATAISYPLKLIMPESWDKVVDGITLKLTRDLLTEMAEVLMDWYKDPKTLCCIIKNLAALGSMMREQDFSKDNWNEEKQKFFSGVRAEQLLGSDYFKTLNILRQIREYLALIIEILNLDFTNDLFSSFDIGKELSDMLIGIMIAIMEAMIAAGKKAWYDKVQEWFKDLNELDLNCSPLKQLVDVLFRFMSDDHGLFNLIRRYINEYARYLKWRFINNFKKKYVSKTKDLTFLRFLYDLIDKIIKALENFEMCIEADYTMVDNPPNPLSNWQASDLCPYGISARVTNNWENCPYRTYTNNDIVCRVNERIPNNNGRTSYCIHPDAISDYFGNQNFRNPVNVGKLKNNQYSPIGSKVGDRGEIAVVFPSDNELKNFFVNHMGYTPSQADNILSQSKKSTDEGKVELGLESLGMKDSSSTTTDGRTVNHNADYIDKRKELMSALGDCAKTLNPKTIADLANKLTDIL